MHIHVSKCHMWDNLLLTSHVDMCRILCRCECQWMWGSHMRVPCLDKVAVLPRHLLVLCRFQESTSRLTVKFTAPEGAPGKITVYIIPALPPKTCSAIEVQLLPLCLHQVVPNPSSELLQQRMGVDELQGSDGLAVLFEQLQLDRPFSQLTLQGQPQRFHCCHFCQWNVCMCSK